jgi:hypothetical protein
LNIKRKTISLVAASSVAVTTLAGIITLTGSASASASASLVVCNQTSYTVDVWGVNQGLLMKLAPHSPCTDRATSGSADEEVAWYIDGTGILLGSLEFIGDLGAKINVTDGQNVGVPNG